MLLKQMHINHSHASVYVFASVANGEQGHLYGDEHFHLQTRLADGFDGGGALQKRILNNFLNVSWTK